MNFVFSWLSDFKEEVEHTHAHTYSHEGAFGINYYIHVPVFLHTKTQELRVAPDEKNIVAVCVHLQIK